MIYLVSINKGQPQGIAPTQCHVGAIPCGCPLSVFFKYLKIYGSVLKIAIIDSNSSSHVVVTNPFDFSKKQKRKLYFTQKFREAKLLREMVDSIIRLSTSSVVLGYNEYGLFNYARPLSDFLPRPFRWPFSV